MPPLAPNPLRYLLLLAGLLGLAPLSQAAQPLGCLIEPHRVVELGSPVVGVLESGSRSTGAASVRKGQVLASLRAEVERAAADVAQEPGPGRRRPARRASQPRLQPSNA
jgi:hypothetical protein